MGPRTSDLRIMSRGHAPAESSDRDGQRVLLVEDHSDIRRVLRVSLEAEGYSVVEASNGPEGIDRVEATHPDLVILDLMLPVKDGWWFLREVQQCPAPRPVVIILSARAGQGERLVAQNLGAAAFMVKPFEPDDVVTKVRSLIGSTEKEQRGAV
jgi:two-component system, OmpR family, KDP operon response regulator KdpE